MQALWCSAFGPIADLRLTDVDTPQPVGAQVLIRVRAAALNFPDALIVQGLYQMKPPLPFAPGAEVAGEIIAVGPGVKRLRVGERVIALIGYGGFAECALAPEAQCMPLPEGMDYASGAALALTYGTALHALKDCAQLQAGERVLILGAAGGVGSAAIEIAKTLGAQVIAAASSAPKLALCREIGADALINTREENLKDRAMALSDGQGIDVVVDPVGGALSEAALRATAWRGRYLVIGFAAGEIPRLPLNLALLQERRILGVFWGEAVRRDPRTHLANMAQLQAWFSAGRITPRITERVPLSGAGDAIARIAARLTLGKVVIEP